MRTYLFAALAITLLVAPALAAPVPRSQSHPYVSWGPVLEGAYCFFQYRDQRPDEEREFPEVNFNGACFYLDGNETAVQFSIRDAVSPNMGGKVWFLTRTNQQLGSEFFCDDSPSYAIPTGTFYILVAAVDRVPVGPVTLAPRAGDCPGATLPTTGVIEAHFT